MPYTTTAPTTWGCRAARWTQGDTLDAGVGHGCAGGGSSVDSKIGDTAPATSTRPSWMAAISSIGRPSIVATCIREGGKQASVRGCVLVYRWMVWKGGDAVDEIETTGEVGRPLLLQRPGPGMNGEKGGSSWPLDQRGERGGGEGPLHRWEGRGKSSWSWVQEKWDLPAKSFLALPHAGRVARAKVAAARSGRARIEVRAGED
eukprot:363736-Chlamydomonas_euryale.AAC.2